MRFLARFIIITPRSQMTEGSFRKCNNWEHQGEWISSAIKSALGIKKEKVKNVSEYSQCNKKRQIRKLYIHINNIIQDLQLNGNRTFAKRIFFSAESRSHHGRRKDFIFFLIMNGAFSVLIVTFTEKRK